METDRENSITEFREASGRIFTLTWEEFVKKAEKLSRQTDENVFQQLQSAYIDLLRIRLTQTVEELLNQFRGDRHQLHNNLTELVSYTLSEFLLKSRCL